MLADSSTRRKLLYNSSFLKQGAQSPFPLD
nr:MAG TPA: hypothetical protein [Caudoviricetes sp.]